MTIDEAIKQLSRIAECQDEDWLDFEYYAFQLGIEALKRYQAYQSQGDTHSGLMLPGETEE